MSELISSLRLTLLKSVEVLTLVPVENLAITFEPWEDEPFLTVSSTKPIANSLSIISFPSVFLDEELMKRPFSGIKAGFTAALIKLSESVVNKLRIQALFKENEFSLFVTKNPDLNIRDASDLCKAYQNFAFAADELQIAIDNYNQSRQ